MEQSLANVYQSNQMVDSVAVIHPVDSNGVATTSAAIKAAIEGINGGTVYFVAGTYTIDELIEPNSNTKIVGLGDVQLVWDGLAWVGINWYVAIWGSAHDGIMFNNISATNVTYENIHWIYGSKNYSPVSLYQGDILNNCQHDTTGCPIYVRGSSGIYNCKDLSEVYMTDTGCNISNSVITIQLAMYSIVGIKVSKSFINYVYIEDADSFTTDLDIVFESCDLTQLPGLSIGPCIFIYTSATGLSIIKNIKFNNCILEPFDNTFNCVEVTGSANLAVYKVEFASCEFRDCLNAYSVGADTIISGWRLKDNEYVDLVGVRYDFTETPLALDLSKDGGYL